MGSKIKIYVVYGPSAEWGDGVGPRGYFTSRNEAEEFLMELIQEEGMQACGIVEFDAEEIGFNPDEKTLEEFIDELNSLV